MSDELTVDGCLKELRRLLPVGTFATVIVHSHGDMNRPENMLKTVNSAEIYIEGGYWFRGATLKEALNAFKQSQSEGR